MTKSMIVPEGWALTHVDTCLSEYVLDHCNGDNELLVGVVVGPGSTYASVLDDVKAELDVAVIDKPGFDYDAADRTVEAAFADHDPEAAFTDLTPEPDEETEGEMPSAWFRLSWPMPHEAA